MKTKLILTLAAAALVAGCTSTKFKDGTVEFKRTSFASKVSIPELTATVATNGTRTIVLKGYANDGSQVIGIAVDAAVKAAVKAAVPVP